MLRNLAGLTGIDLLCAAVFGCGPTWTQLQTRTRRARRRRRGGLPRYRVPFPPRIETSAMSEAASLTRALFVALQAARAELLRAVSGPEGG